MSIHIGCLKLPLSNDANDHLGGIRLRLFQAQLRRCNNPRVLLEAPTSSGKTLAYLIRAIETRGVDSQFGTTVIVYPTNALTWDQANALHNLMKTKLEKKVNLTVESDEDVKWRTEDQNAEVDLYVLNGETLAAISQESKNTEGKSIIEQLRRNQAKKRIILTNPEILYYIFLYKFARAEDLIASIFHENPPNLLILDEFHLYHGYALATMSYMLAYLKGLFDQIIFSSATPIDVERVIHERIHRISAEPSTEGDVIRHPMDLELESTKSILSSEEIPQIKNLIDLNYKNSRDLPQAIKVLVILSSVIACVRLQESLEKDYPREITPIHGLVPPKSRPRKQSDFKPIVVGTSAIEVGVDFDTSSLIIEAHDYSSFVQRIGRGARHSRCSATAFIPALYVGQFRERITKIGEITPRKLNSVAECVLPNLSSYTDFPLSAQAAPILLAVLLNWTFQRSPRGRRLNNGMAVSELKKQLEDKSILIPSELEFFRELLLDMCKESAKIGILEMARKMSCRSSLDSIPAVFTNRYPAQFDQLSLLDLPRLNFNLVEKEALENRGIKIPWKMRFQREFVEVNGIRENQHQIKIAFKPGRFEEMPAPLTNFRLITEDNNLEGKILQILRGQPAYVLYGKEDWRLPGFFTTSGDFLVVGGDAYLAWFMRQGKGIK